MSIPLILVIDDSQTIRKLVDCHLTQAGYRVVLAPDAETGIERARTTHPDLILLDHQLPGTTGFEVAKQLLADEITAHIPVVISSTLRNRAFVQYADCPNVVDQIPKPFTSEMLKSGVANALQTGTMVVRAQQTGTAVPEAVDEVRDPILEGDTAVLPLRAVFDFLNNLAQSGRLTVDHGQDRIRFTLGQGRIQAVVSPTIPASRFESFLPEGYADLAPLLPVTLAEHQDGSMAGLVKLLERSLSDPRRLRGLLRFQAAGLTYWALSAPPAGSPSSRRPPCPRCSRRSRFRRACPRSPSRESGISRRRGRAIPIKSSRARPRAAGTWIARG